jgi:hypothetical protein
VGGTDTGRAAAEVVGLYLDPPEKALVLRLGGAGARPRDDALRQAAARPATRLAAADGPEGGAEADVLAFLELVEKQVPADLEILAILTSGSPDAGPLLARWLERPHRARWHLQLTPAGSSWQSVVEPWLRELCRPA